jgi:hypothetical protein
MTRNIETLIGIRCLFVCACLPCSLPASADTLANYASLTGKTVLRPATLPALPDSIGSDLPSDPTNAIAKIESALAEKGIIVLQDGPHFVRIAPKQGLYPVTNPPFRGAELAAAKGQETLPAGMIDFINADLSQVLPIYAMLSQRTILRSAVLPPTLIKLKTQSPLSQSEVLYAFATVLALNGICLVDDGKKFVQIVPFFQRDEVKPQAPKPEPGAKQFDPKHVPSMGVLRPSVGPMSEIERLEQELDRLRRKFYDFMHLSDPSRFPARRLLEFYADLAGKTPVPSKNFDATPLWFQVETPLTKAELLYAIETSFRLNNLTIIPLEAQKIRLGHINELRKGTTRSDRFLRVNDPGGYSDHSGSG